MVMTVNESAENRWLTSDALGGDVTSPQSLNRYAYVTNNPATFTDPLGLASPDPADMCSDPEYAESHAECETPGDYLCFYYGLCGGYYGGPYGGGGGGYGGGGGGPITPPAGQPPLAGGSGAMGNAMFGGLITCTYAKVKIGGVPYPGGPTTCIFMGLGISGGVTAALNYLKVHPVTISVAYGVAGQLTYQYSTGTICGSGGLGASYPPTKWVTFGVLNAGNMGNWTNVVSGFSYTFGANVVPGYQGSFNSSGTVGGPTIAPGAGLSGSYTWGACGTIP